MRAISRVRRQQNPKNTASRKCYAMHPLVRKDPLARNAWRQLAPILQRMGLLTELDVSAFTVLCLTWARLERARHRLASATRRAKAPYTVEQLEAIRKCEVSVEKAEHSWRVLAGEFGLTPASRNRLDVVAPKGTLSDDEEALEAESFRDRYLKDPQ